MLNLVSPTFDLKNLSFTACGSSWG